MRRALVLLSVVVLGLLATSPVASAAEASILKPEFKLRADGFLVGLKVESDSRHVVLTLLRHGQIAYYEATAQITEDSVKAHFGRFGDLDYTFTPAAGKRPRCGGARGLREGTFRGTFDFTGENGYVKFEADHAHGTFEVVRSSECERARVDAGKGKEDEVTLTATTGRRPPVDYLLVFTLKTNKGPRLFLNGFRAEKREGMLIERGAQVITRPGALQWDPKAGTARLNPPAPFQGSAEFRRRPHGKPIWRGSLRVPLLGGGTLHLAGGRFKASLGTGSIIG